MNLIQYGDFVLNSGVKSKWKIECDAFSDEDWKGLAVMVARMMGNFYSVEGVPRGGIKLAEALRPYCVSYGPHLIVDDVLTTGGSMKRVADLRMEQEMAKNQPLAYPGSVGAVIFARGECPRWIKAVFQMPKCFWLNGVTR